MDCVWTDRKREHEFSGEILTYGYGLERASVWTGMEWNSMMWYGMGYGYASHRFFRSFPLGLIIYPRNTEKLFKLPILITGALAAHSLIHHPIEMPMVPVSFSVSVRSLDIHHLISTARINNRFLLLCQKFLNFWLMSICYWIHAILWYRILYTINCIVVHLPALSLESWALSLEPWCYIMFMHM